MQATLLKRSAPIACAPARRPCAMTVRAAMQPMPGHPAPMPAIASVEEFRMFRRALLIGAAWLVLPATPFKVKKAAAEEEEVTAPAAYKKLKGYVLPPDSYMGYEPNSTYDVKYTIDYPADWVVERPTKTEKSTMGMDTHVHHSKTDKVEAFVIALSGPDYRGAQLDKDPVAQLRTMAGSDFELRDAMTDAVSLKTSVGKQNGRVLYYYDLASDHMHYLSTMMVDPRDGTMYALMAKAPAGRMFDKNEEALRHIQQSFTLM